MAVHVGANLLGFGGGRDVIAAVLAHEIGRNLGLNHVASGTNNLMSPGGTEERLTAAHGTTAFTNHPGIDSFEFLQPYATSTQYPLWVAALSGTGRRHLFRT